MDMNLVHLVQDEVVDLPDRREAVVEWTNVSAELEAVDRVFGRPRAAVDEPASDISLTRLLRTGIQLGHWEVVRSTVPGHPKAEGQVRPRRLERLTPPHPGEPGLNGGLRVRPCGAEKDTIADEGSPS
jgi:hypothetical protein